MDTLQHIDTLSPHRHTLNTHTPFHHVDTLSTHGHPFARIPSPLNAQFKAIHRQPCNTKTSMQHVHVLPHTYCCRSLYSSCSALQGVALCCSVLCCRMRGLACTTQQHVATFATHTHPCNTYTPLQHIYTLATHTHPCNTYTPLQPINTNARNIHHCNT